MSREQRRLAAIVCADVVGYSRLVGADESATLSRLRRLRAEVLDPRIAGHGGRLVKTTGDGLLVEFSSVVDAVRCAVAIQRDLAAQDGDLPADRRIVFRIGIHMGDIVIDGDDILGDGVNVAARLEALAVPGGICLSARVQEDLAGRLDLDLRSGGEQALKNIARPVHVWHWSPAGTAAMTARPARPSAMPDRPSVAVLPFTNMSGDPEQEYFADGITEDIITELSRFRSLFVIARNSSFTYKGKAVDVRTVARELGVRYVLEGSVRKAGTRVRITGQLIEADAGGHIWAERYDGDLTDIFDLQDRVTLSVVGAIAPRLEQAEIERSGHKAPDNLDAYDLYLRGMSCIYARSFDEARRYGTQAIALDPDYGAAHALVAYADTFLISSGKPFSPEEVAETARLAQRAIALSRDDATLLSMGAWAMAHVVQDLGTASAAAARALELNPNTPIASFVGGWIATWTGRANEGVEHFLRAIRFSPLDPNAFRFHIGLAHAYYMSGDDEGAIKVSMPVVRAKMGPAGARIAAAANAMVGQVETARECLEVLRQFDPERRLSTLHRVLGPYQRRADVERYIEGLRRAGLPE